MQAITAATGHNAKLLHLDDRGTIAVGKRADLLVLDANPLTGYPRKIVALYHDGAVLRTYRVNEENERTFPRIKVIGEEF